MTKATLQQMVDRRRAMTEAVEVRRRAATLDIKTRASFPNDQPAEVIRIAVIHVRREIQLMLEALDAIDVEVTAQAEEAPKPRGALGPNQSMGPAAGRHRRGPA